MKFNSSFWFLLSLNNNFLNCVRLVANNGNLPRLPESQMAMLGRGGSKELRAFLGSCALTVTSCLSFCVRFLCKLLSAHSCACRAWRAMQWPKYITVKRPKLPQRAGDISGQCSPATNQVGVCSLSFGGPAPSGFSVPPGIISYGRRPASPGACEVVEIM